MPGPATLELAVTPKLSKRARKAARAKAARKAAVAKERKRIARIPSTRPTLVWSPSMLFTGHALDRLIARELLIGDGDAAGLVVLADAARFGNLIESAPGVQHRCIVWHGWFVTLVVKVTATKRVVLAAWAHPSKFASASCVAEFIVLPPGVTREHLRRHAKPLKRHDYTGESFALAA